MSGTEKLCSQVLAGGCRGCAPVTAASRTNLPPLDTLGGPAPAVFGLNMKANKTTRQIMPEAHSRVGTICHEHMPLVAQASTTCAPQGSWGLRATQERGGTLTNAATLWPDHMRRGIARGLPLITLEGICLPLWYVRAPADLTSAPPAARLRMHRCA